MTTRSPASRLWLVVIVGVAYVVIGVATAALAGTAASPRGVTAWRLAAWLLSLAAFLAHLVYDRLRPDSTSASTARHVAAAVALGAFLLAAAGPVRSHWATPNFWRVAALSVVVWPILAGIPAFVAALVLGSIIGRAHAKGATGRSYTKSPS